MYFLPWHSIRLKYTTRSVGTHFDDKTMVILCLRRKGQLISKGLLDVVVWTKKQTICEFVL